MRHVRWYWPDDDRWNYDELDADGWSLRHVEVRGADGAVVAAGSLAEVLVARDTGGPEAVVHYESRFGIVPAGPFPEPSQEHDPPLAEVTAEEFEALWRAGRRRLG